MLRGKKKNSKIILISSVALLTCAAVGGYFLLQPGQNQSVVVNNKVDSKTVQEAVDEAKKKSLVLSGEVAPNNSSKVKIDPSKGEVKEVFVKNGDTVTQGQPLFSYVTSQELTAQSAQYDAQAKSNSISTAQSNASIKWETYNRKLANLNSLREKYNANNDESLLDQIKSAEDEVAQSLSDANSADNEVKNAQIEAEKAQATAQTESDRMKYDTVTAELQVGQKVEVVDRKNPKKKWTGTVTQVGTLTADAAANGNKQQQENPNQAKYPYKVELDQAENMPLIGSHTYVNVIENAPEAGKVVVNKSYVFTENGKSYVWKVENKKIKKQEVKTKALKGSLIEITEGLKREDSISSVKDGMKEGMEVGADVKA